MRTRFLWSIVLVLVLLATPAAAGNRFGIFAGVNIASQGGDMEMVGNQLADELAGEFGGTWTSGTSSLTGGAFGLGIFIPTSPTFGLELDLQYIRRGSKIQNAGTGLTNSSLPSSLTSSFQLNYIEIPILARYSPSPDAGVRPLFLVGPVIGLKTGATLDIDVSGTNQDTDISAGYEDFTFGLLFGAGVDIAVGEATNLLVQARYFLGLTNPVDDPDLEAKSQDLGFFAGLEFALPNKKGRGNQESQP